MLSVDKYIKCIFAINLTSGHTVTLGHTITVCERGGGGGGERQTCRHAATCMCMCVW